MQEFELRGECVELVELVLAPGMLEHHAEQRLARAHPRGSAANPVTSLRPSRARATLAEGDSEIDGRHISTEPAMRFVETA